MTADLRFFVGADQGYEDYFPLYAAAALHHVAGSSVEVCLQDAYAFDRGPHGDAVRYLRHTFGADRILTRTASSLQAGARPNTVRFLEEPTGRPEYVYIGDIDIIILDRNLREQHLRFMQRTGLPYSNALRPQDKTRLSGLHFTRYDAMYPLPDISDVDVRHVNDERVLRTICERKGLPLNEVWFRPQHGIHASPNRPAMPTAEIRMHWQIPRYAEAYREFTGSALMRTLRPMLSARIQWVLATIDYHAGLSPVEAGEPPTSHTGRQGLPRRRKGLLRWTKGLLRRLRR